MFTNHITNACNLRERKMRGGGGRKEEKEGEKGGKEGEK